MSGSTGRRGALKYLFVSVPCTGIRVLGMLVLSLVATASVHAQSDVEFDIDAGFASHTLNEYAKQARVEIGFPGDEIQGIRTNAIRGEYAPEDALSMMLRGTELAFRRELDTFTIYVAAPSAETNTQLTEGATYRLSTEGQTSGPSSAAGPRPDFADDLSVQEPPLEELLVTGSRIRGANGASPVVTITRQEIELAGYATVEEVIDYLPQNFGGATSQDTARDGRASDTVVGGHSGSITAGSAINLRGLGTSSTLVLINGRRVSSSGIYAGYVDVSNIPLSAIERVEVLTDGASAVYGADAIAGVVNFILRETYDGQETRLRYASDVGGDTSEILFGQSVGRSWDSGRALFSYEYYRHENLSSVDREVAASSDLRRFGGDDWRPAGGNPANIVAGGQTFAIPAGQDGSNLTAADFEELAGVVNRHDIRANEDFLPEQERHSVYVSFAQDMGKVELFADLWYSTRDSTMFGDQGQRDLVIPSNNPFFVDPTDSGLDSVRIQGYSFQADLGPFINSGKTDYYSSVLGATFDLGQTWQLEVSGAYSRETAESTFMNFVNRNALESALVQSDPALAFNPFGDGSHTAPGVIEGMKTSGNGTYVSNTLSSVDIAMDGDVFELRGNPVKVATGIEYRKEWIDSRTIEGYEVDSPNVAPGTDRSRDIVAAYSEFLFPLIRDTDGRGLELSLAARYEDYSDFGSSVDPKVGISWTASETLTLQGTYGTSFKAPGLSDLDTSDPSSDVFFYYPPLPIIPMATIFLLGGNENLTAETATTWTAGFQLAPKRIDGLSLQASYFDIDFTDRVERPYTDIRQAFEPRFSTLLTLNPTREQIEEVLQDPRYQNIFGVSDADLLSGAAPVGAIADSRINNLANSHVSGVDLQMNYLLDTALGDFTFSLNGNYLIDFERALIAGDPLVDEVDTLGRPVDLRARAGVVWNTAKWTTTGFVNYMDEYTDNLSDPHRTIDSWTTVDLSLSYRFGTATAPGRATRVLLSVQNAFDEDPPFANSPGGMAYDSSNANGRGRFAGLQIQIPW